MSVEAVKRFFVEKGLEDPVIELPGSGATVDEAAETLGVDPARIAKTLAFRIKDRDVLIVMRGNARIDNKKFKQFFAVKAKLLEQNEVEEITGHPVGGVCPFGLKNKLEVYLDITVKEYDYVYPAAGSRTTALKIHPYKMQELTGAEWIDVCQG